MGLGDWLADKFSSAPEEVVQEGPQPAGMTPTAAPALPDVPVVPDAQEKAVLDMIAKCEGTFGVDGYHALYGWKPGDYTRLFSSYNDHPRIKFYLNGTKVPDGVKPAPYTYTTAAGRYQWTASSWDDMLRRHGDCDFSPQSQDVMTLNKLDELGATADIHAGNLQAAIDKMGGTWASLPTSKANQPTRTFDFCCAAFTEAGGTLA